MSDSDNDFSKREGHVIHERDSGLVTVMSFGQVVHSFTARQPAYRDHKSMIGMLADAGFARDGFRVGFARDYHAWMRGVRLPRKPCNRSGCRCSDQMRDDWYSSELLDLNGETSCLWHEAKRYEEYWKSFDGVVPDAWIAVPEHRVLIVAEVDVHHPAPPDKYVNVWWWLDCESWSLVQMHVDRYGSISAPHEPGCEWFGHLEREIEDRRCEAAP